MRALRKVGISRTPTRHTPVRLRLLKKSFFGRSSQWHAAIRTTINRSSSFASNKFIVNSVCCSRALVSGPTSKVLASGGGLGSGQLLMMWSAVCSGSPHSHAALSAHPTYSWLIMETMIRDHMMDFLIKHKLINPSQHGFLKARSCLTKWLCFLEELTKWVDDGSPVDVIYLDFQKAFDKVPNQRLILKLKATKLISGLRGLRYEEPLWTDNTRNTISKGGGSNRSV